MNMSDDRPFYTPTQPPRVPRDAEPAELLFEFFRVRDHTRWRCELRDHGRHGIEAQFSCNERFMYSRMFAAWLDSTRTPRDMAVQWAEEERKAIEQ
jgi:hypothetical protein